MLKTRNRLVNFRLTQEEYEKIHAALLSKGVRCLSDFARDAVLRYAESDHNGDVNSYLDRRVADLELSVNKLQQSLVTLVSKFAPEV